MLGKKNYTLGSISSLLMKQLEAKTDKAVYFFKDSRVLKQGDTLESLYNQYRDPQDSILYLHFSYLPTFG